MRLTRPEEWQERRTIIEEFEYYIKTVDAGDSEQLKPLMGLLRRTFVAGSGSTIVNLIEAAKNDDLDSWNEFIRSYEDQLNEFMEEIKKGKY